jgi:outer membrane lipoprotein SlyB
MKSIIATIVLVSGIALTPIDAFAGERVNDAILGGVSGALVAGPVGLVAGGVIGYTAGPNISHGMGLHNHKRNNYQRRAARNSDRSYR